MQEIEKIYKDHDIIVCRKPAGLAVQTKKPGQMDLYSLLMNEEAREKEKGQMPYIGIVHRLDQPVEGVMVFARTPEAAASLNRQMQKDGFGKYYYAVVKGKMPAKTGVLQDTLQRDGRTNLSRVVPKGTVGGKLAELSYETVAQEQEYTLLRICLKTGRHHQIRVQLSHAGCPILGDRKYGTVEPGEPSLALCSYRLQFAHPIQDTPMDFTIQPEGDGFANISTKHSEMRMASHEKLF